MAYRYKTKGSCSRSIDIDVQDGVIHSVVFDGGCAGNTKGLGMLLAGMKVEDAIGKLQGIQCRNGTSCPDQLARALIKMQGEATV